MDKNEKRDSEKDIENLYKFMDTQQLNIEVDPTILSVGDIELAGGRSNDESNDPSQRENRLTPADRLDIQRQLTDDYQSNIDFDGLFDENQNNGDIIKLPSVYVHERLEILNNKVNKGRRRRNFRWYIFNFGKIILNIVYFYVLFFIGLCIFLTFPINDGFCDLLYSSYNLTICMPNIQQISSNEVIVKSSNFTVYKAVLPNIEKIVSNISTVIIPILVNHYLIKLQENQTHLLPENSINLISSQVRDILQNYTIKLLHVTDLVVSNLSSTIINSESINTKVLRSLELYTYSFGAIFSNITSMVVQNITSAIINSIDVIGERIASASLFGNTLNKCNVGQC